jgi:putative 2-oxoglutarate oxygenase
MMMEIRKLGEEIGAEISGVDVKNLSDDEWKKVYQTWLDHNVIVVRDQELGIEDFYNYSLRFGPVEAHPSKSTRHAEFPKITVLGVGKFDEDGRLDMAVYRRGAEEFHTDGAYDQDPFKATQLYAIAIPSRGGDTHFASMYSAYDALPQRLKDKLAGKRAAFRYGGRTGRAALLNEEDRHELPAVHPILRVHPETGRTGLYFDPGKILSIEGFEEAESDEIIDELETYMLQPKGMYTHTWRVGDVVIWDNRCSYHKAAGDYPPEEDRIHWRVSIKDYGSPIKPD